MPLGDVLFIQTLWEKKNWKHWMHLNYNLENDERSMIISLGNVWTYNIA